MPKRTKKETGETAPEEKSQPEAHMLRVGKLSDEAFTRIEKLIAGAGERGVPRESILAKGDLGLRTSKKGAELLILPGRYGCVRRALRDVLSLPSVSHGEALPTQVE